MGSAGDQTHTWILKPHVKSAPPSNDPAAGLEEACSLARALPGLHVAGADIIALYKTQPGTLFGKGKIAELKNVFHDQDIDLVIIDGPVSPVQQRNLEKAWDLKILDRTSLILEIFSDRAQTNEGKLQVEMAALSYQRTRLVRAWTHLERQRGGLGFVGGPGETQIEADRRAIDEQLVRLRKKLAKVVKTRDLHRKGRAKVPYPIVALVGYTNAGKSTLFNQMTGADVVAKDMLFATLDPTMRSIRLPSGTDVILSDTVGFVSDLPTELVAAFRATLEEVCEADLIVHVRDISHPNTESQAKEVVDIVESLGVSDDVPVIEVWNKADKLTGDAYAACQNQADRLDNTFLASALTNTGLDDIFAAIPERLFPARFEQTIKLAFSDGDKRAWLYQKNLVVGEQPDDNGLSIAVKWDKHDRDRFMNL